MPKAAKKPAAPKKAGRLAGSAGAIGGAVKQKVYKLRLTDPESSRVVAILDKTGKPFGAGCLIDGRHILTCFHVADDERVKTKTEGVKARLVGVTGQPEVGAKLLTTVSSKDKDIALLEIEEGWYLDVTPVLYASPLRHGGKSFSVLGFPIRDDFGITAQGSLFPADAAGAIQMDSEGNVLVDGGFSGAPVWCQELGAYIGMVSTHKSEDKIGWCIPSRELCEVVPNLQVRYRVPPADRPVINDWELDDPNVDIYGTQSRDDKYELSACVKDKKKYFEATVTLRRPDGKVPPGGYVTFITYPDFKEEDEDAYELFARFDDKSGKAEVIFYPAESFTVAAVFEGGGRWLTFHLKDSRPKAKAFE